MKLAILSLTAALATTAIAAPLVEYGSYPSSMVAPGSSVEAQVGKLDIGGLQTPSAFSSTLNTKTAPINYGNLNQGTGMMPSQVVHYGTENQPDRGYISPILISTTAKDATFQVAKAEKAAGGLINADLDVGKLQHTKYTDVNTVDAATGEYGDDDDENEDPAKWGWSGYYRQGYWGQPW
ncbi:hypothetical protein BGX28_008737, partial [Mortierella sp. GBA30]